MSRLLRLRQEARLHPWEAHKKVFEDLDHPRIRDFVFMAQFHCTVDMYQEWKTQWILDKLPQHFFMEIFLQEYDHFLDVVRQFDHTFAFLEQHFRFLGRGKSFEDTVSFAQRLCFEQVLLPHIDLFFEALPPFLTSFRCGEGLTSLDIPNKILSLFFQFPNQEIFDLWRDKYVQIFRLHDYHEIDMYDRLHMETALAKHLYRSGAPLLPFIAKDILLGMDPKDLLERIFVQQQTGFFYHYYQYFAETFNKHFLEFLQDRFKKGGGVWPVLQILSQMKNLADHYHYEFPPVIREWFCAFVEKHGSDLRRDFLKHLDTFFSLVEMLGSDQIGTLFEWMGQTYWKERCTPGILESLSCSVKRSALINKTWGVMMQNLFFEIKNATVLFSSNTKVYCCAGPRFFREDYPLVPLPQLPPYFIARKEAFETLFSQEFPYRKIQWVDWYSTVDLTNGCQLGLPHYLVVNLLCQKKESRIEDLCTCLGWDRSLLFPVLHSLCFHKQPLLVKSGPGPSFCEKETLTLTKIPLKAHIYSLPKRQKRNAKTSPRDEREDGFVLRALIMRILKKHRILGMSFLSNEVQKMAKTAPSKIQKAIDYLIEQDYLEKDEQGRIVYVP